MARTQEIMWTVLPNGFTKPDKDGKQNLKLSVFVSPRLETSAPTGTLGQFPDFESQTPGANWAATVKAMKFNVRVRTTLSATVSRAYAAKVVSEPEPELWDEFFGPDMPIKQYQFRDLSKSSVKTFSQTSVFSTVKAQYAGIATSPSLAYKLPTIAKLVQVPGIKNPPLVKILPTPVLRTSAMRSLAAAPVVKQDPVFKAFEDFHKPWVLPPNFEALRPPYPPMDFHRALSALGNYPALLRRLGLIIDLEVPYNTTIYKSKRIMVQPTWGDGRVPRGTLLTAADGVQVTHNDAMPWTAYDLKRTSSKPQRVSWFATASRDGSIKNGYLVTRASSASKDPLKLYNFDVDLAAVRLLDTAVSASEIVSRTVPTPVRAAAEKGRQVSASAVVAAASTSQMGLPTLGQPMIQMAMSGVAKRVNDQFKVAAEMQTRLAAGHDGQNTNFAEDVNRGYRIDVWDSVTRKWHPLCRRIGTYAIGTTPIAWGGAASKSDEGWVQLGGTSNPMDAITGDTPSEMRIHESLFDWSGWSLAAPRPGNTLAEPDSDGISRPKKEFVGPDGETYAMGRFLHPDLPLDVEFAVPPRTLPRLRFGTTYRFRARAVDLAGNSIAFAAGSTRKEPAGTSDSNVLVSRAVTHKRYEPVKPPTVIQTQDPKPSESPHVLVVRSYHQPGSGTVITENTARHVTPPRTSVTMAEACGGLDASSSGKPMDGQLWSLLCNRDDYDFPYDDERYQVPQSTLPSPVAYLPDPFSRGAAFAGLPGVSAAVTRKRIGTGAVISGVRVPLSSTKNETVASARVAFDQTSKPWYDKRPFKLQLQGIEATDTRLAVRARPRQPAWNESSRVLSVELPKADEHKVKMSSYANSADLQVMGVYHWGLEKYVPLLATTVLKATSTKASALAMAPKAPTAAKSSLPRAANALIGAATTGQNWLLTPPQEITLVHAVDLPMIPPALSSRAHLERHPGQTHATLVDWMPVHGKSTVKLDVSAKWSENVDDPKASAPQWGETAARKAAAVFSLGVEPSQETVLNIGQSTPKSMKNVAWGVIPQPSMLISRRGLDTKPQRHFFGDTKHRRVGYTATYMSRFEKYFADRSDLAFTLSSAEKMLHVPSAARPAAPAVEYVIPTFGWTRLPGSSKREGGGLRVYLARPWFSSGDDEQLAVIVYQPITGQSAIPAALRWNSHQPFVSEWGRDPLWKTLGSLPSSRPTTSRFLQKAGSKSSLVLTEIADSKVSVAAYDVDYDPDAKLWFADIVIDQGKAYMPFIKLALARYQRYSLPGLELSPVVVADFVQLTPDRLAAVSVGSDGLTVSVSVSGQTYSDSDAKEGASVTVVLEKKAGSDENTGWAPLTSETELRPRARSAVQILTGDTRRTWSGTAKLTENVAGTKYRAVVREYEFYKRYGSTEPARRLVYVDTVALTARPTLPIDIGK